ncbi:stage III sporulation protein AG [Tepidibacillus infernus]|uniref:Stage III sporulation protein AG n=1 Tax=Tepidibacillus decaturensis TaxID=1413211 RepID=A0A135L2S6_9BACI|nr:MULTISPECIES: stage III sporulation protein AG [Tepidibacillus]KXG43285.1 hypothetical protein U473_04095 [Tepidibacillus decaturensis]GBF11031.1 hypothetical protein HK1_01049 [Tepidibacillus sp. HK-1]
MDKEKQQHWLLKWLGGESGEKKRTNKLFGLVLLILLGMAIMLLSPIFGITEQVKPYDAPPLTVQETAGVIDKTPSPKTMQDYEKIFENQLTDILTDMIGVEEVTVKVNLDSTEEIVIEKNRNYTEQQTKERDKQGGTRDITDIKKDEQVVLYQTDNQEQPVVLKTLKPKVRGVVVIAKGAEKVQVKAMIAEAVQRLLDVPPYKIAILPRKG